MTLDNTYVYALMNLDDLLEEWHILEDTMNIEGLTDAEQERVCSEIDRIEYQMKTRYGYTPV